MTEKEEKAIKSCKLLLNGDISLHILDDDGGTAYAGEVNKLYNDDLDTVIQALEQKDKEIQELKKYDIRNIKIDKDKIISSPSFTRKEVDLMNLGIALSLNADKLFNDESEE